MDTEKDKGPRSRTGAKGTPTATRRGPGRQSRSATELRTLELLDKALDLFLEKGFERTTIDGIAASVGMAKRTVYLRYGDKAKLFKASLQRAIEEWIVPVERLRATETDDLEETLVKIGDILVANVISPAGLRLLRITNAESGRMPEIGAFTNSRGTGPTITYLTDLIRRRVRPGGVGVDDPESAAKAFLFLVIGGPASLIAWGIPLAASSIDKHTRYSVHLFLHGLLQVADPVGGGKVANLIGNTKRSTPTCAARSGHAAGDSAEGNPLALENRRLKVLLANAMLELAAAKERSR